MSENKFMKVSSANKSVVERIVDQITNAIINGELKPGDKIPTEPELCLSLIHIYHRLGSSGRRG